MSSYNKLTPELAAELRAIVGERRFEYGDQVKENYSHDEMPIYGKYMPEAVCFVTSTEEVSEIMKLCHANPAARAAARPCRRRLYFQTWLLRCRQPDR